MPTNQPRALHETCAHVAVLDDANYIGRIYEAARLSPRGMRLDGTPPLNPRERYNLRIAVGDSMVELTAEGIWKHETDAGFESGVVFSAGYARARRAAIDAASQTPSVLVVDDFADRRLALEGALGVLGAVPLGVSTLDAAREALDQRPLSTAVVGPSTGDVPPAAVLQLIADVFPQIWRVALAPETDQMPADVILSCPWTLSEVMSACHLDADEYVK